MDGEDERRGSWEIPELISTVRSSFLNDIERVQGMLVSREAKKDLQIERLADQLQSSEARCANLEVEVGILRHRCAEAEAEVAELGARTSRSRDENSLLKGSHKGEASDIQSTEIGVKKGNISTATQRAHPLSTHDGYTGVLKPKPELIVYIDDSDNKSNYNSKEVGNSKSIETTDVILDDAVKKNMDVKKRSDRFLSVSMRKRKSASKVIVSDSESDDGDIPIDELVRKKNQKKIRGVKMEPAELSVKQYSREPMVYRDSIISVPITLCDGGGGHVGSGERCVQPVLGEGEGVGVAVLAVDGGVEAAAAGDAGAARDEDMLAAGSSGDDTVDEVIERGVGVDDCDEADVGARKVKRAKTITARDWHGPIVDDLLFLQNHHRSERSFRGETNIIKVTGHLLALQHWPMDSRIEPYVRVSGLYYLSCLSYVRCDRRLLTALIERWRPETNTFHMRRGEMTITLQDVAVLLGLRIDGIAVTGSTNCDDWRPICEELLGVAPPANKIKGGRILLSWLRETFHDVPDGELGEDALLQYARGYLLFLLGCTIFVDSTGNRIHACYLPLLRDLHTAGLYSWGSAMLAHLYRALYKGSLTSNKDAAGYLTLLQLWSWERLHVGRPNLRDEGFVLGDRPLGCRWNAARTFEESPSHALGFYRAQLDHQHETQVQWQPYIGKCEDLPPLCREKCELWRARVPLICFNIIEMHVPDRVARQFGYEQKVPPDVERIERGTRRGRHKLDWTALHSAYIERWDRRLDHIHEFPQTQSTARYMEWYWQRTVRYLTPPLPSHLPSHPPFMQSQSHIYEHNR